MYIKHFKFKIDFLEQVPFVLLDDLMSHLSNWDKPVTSGSETKLSLGDVTVILRNKPFQMEVKRGKEVLLSFNSRSMFQFQHRREKQASTVMTTHGPKSWGFHCHIF